MKNIAMLAVMATLVLLVGCATPSYESMTWDKEGNLLKKVVKYENSTFSLGKALILQVSYDPATYSPTVRIGYGRYETARVYKDGKYTSDMKFTDVNIFSGAGSLNHKITINNAEVYDTAPEVEEPVEAVKVAPIGSRITPDGSTITVEPTSVDDKK